MAKNLKARHTRMAGPIYPRMVVRMHRHCLYCMFLEMTNQDLQS